MSQIYFLPTHGFTRKPKKTGFSEPECQKIFPSHRSLLIAVPLDVSFFSFLLITIQIIQSMSFLGMLNTGLV